MVKSLGVIFDSNMSLANQVQEVCKNCNFVLYTQRKIFPFISSGLRAQVAGALINSMLDFSDFLYL